MKVEKKAYGTKGLIETHLASKSSPPTIDNSMDHVTRFVSRYSLIYAKTSHCFQGLTLWAEGGGLVPGTLRNNYCYLTSLLS